ncbi:protein rep [Ruficoccus amylovorans]|uniref:Protein rep n=1 Tax=Ruficoccus amylovorans TaxID=1804625 RepID=A0A842HFI3_9BACT|nr:protein rep [Ruficoccus amylovorans]MBC2594396.1 protein rep [Ruficoccus amylovorans]
MITGPPDKREAREAATSQASGKSSFCGSDSCDRKTFASPSVKAECLSAVCDNSNSLADCSANERSATSAANDRCAHATRINTGSKSFATGQANPGSTDDCKSGLCVVAAGESQPQTANAWDLLERLGFEGTETEDFRAPESEYLDICRSYSGESIPVESYEKLVADQAELIRMSDEIATRLADGYYDAELEQSVSRNPWPESAQPLWRYSALTKCKQRLPTYRNIRFLPWQAKMRRGTHLKFLEWWCNRHPFARMFVPTTGARCCVDELRERIQDLQRKTSKLNAKPWFKKHYEIVWRSTEIGTPEQDEAGEWTFHPHAHIIVNQKHFIPPEQWQVLRARIKAHFGGNYFRESGKLAKPREACKYVVKPQAVLELDNKTLIELYDALFKLRLCQPLGSLKESINHFKEHRLKLVRPCKSNGWKWRTVKDWNRHCEKDKDDAELSDEELVEGNIAISEPGNGGCAVLARTQPLPAASTLSEPCLLVMGDIEAGEDEIRNDSRFRELLEAAGPAYRAGQMLEHISVHNSVVTVPPAEQRQLFTVPGIWEHPNSWHPPESFYRAQRTVYPPTPWDDGSVSVSPATPEMTVAAGTAHPSRKRPGPVSGPLLFGCRAAGAKSGRSALQSRYPDTEKPVRHGETGLPSLGVYEEPLAYVRISQ